MNGRHSWSRSPAAAKASSSIRMRSMPTSTGMSSADCDNDRSVAIVQTSMSSAPLSAHWTLHRPRRATMHCCWSVRSSLIIVRFVAQSTNLAFVTSTRCSIMRASAMRLYRRCRVDLAHDQIVRNLKRLTIRTSVTSHKLDQIHVVV